MNSISTASGSLSLLWPAFMFDQAQFGAEGTRAVREHVDLSVTMISALPLCG